MRASEGETSALLAFRSAVATKGSVAACDDSGKERPGTRQHRHEAAPALGTWRRTVNVAVSVPPLLTRPLLPHLPQDSSSWWPRAGVACMPKRPTACPYLD